MLSKDTAICIRAIDYSETSQIATFFARTTGKIDVIAKGSKRPKSSFDGPLEVFSSGQIVFSDAGGEKLSTLTEFQQSTTAGNLRNNLFVLNCGLLGSELLNDLTDEHDPHPELFDSFFDFLRNIADSKERSDVLAFLIMFQLSLLREIGLGPILNACVNCRGGFEGRWGQVYFSSGANGLICRDCEASFVDKVAMSSQSAKCLSSLKMIADADEATVSQIEKILIGHFSELLHRRPRMAAYILPG